MSPVLSLTTRALKMPHVARAPCLMAVLVSSVSSLRRRTVARLPDEPAGGLTLLAEEETDGPLSNAGLGVGSLDEMGAGEFGHEGMHESLRADT